jgi:hypothetical protein
MMASIMKSTSLAAVLMGSGLSMLGAAEGDLPPGPEAPQPPPVPPPADLLGWSHQFRSGMYFNSVYISDESASAPDPTIRGSSSSLSYRGIFEGALAWRSETSALDQKLRLAYGQVRQEDASWLENADEIRYDGVYRRDISKPTFVYRSWGLETVFTSAPPDEDFADPIRVHAGWGIGQLYKDLFAADDALEWRLGVRVQKAWGDQLAPHQDDLTFGPEALLRYEREIDEFRTFFAMYEGWSEFEDLSHVTNLVTAGVNVRFSTYLTIELALRMYYESRPEDLAPDTPGYSRWHIRQDTLIGATAVF